MSAIIDANKKFKRLDKSIAEMKNDKGTLLSVMQDAQELFYCVDEEIQQYISGKTGVPLTTVYGIATFYSRFTLEKKGRHTIGLCAGTACHIRGSKRVQDELEHALGIKAGQVTPDGKFSLVINRCIGCCALAPAMMIDDEVYGRITLPDIPTILKKYE